MNAAAINYSNSPLVSIVMPAKNAEATIVHSLETILGQSYENLEVIVVDDNSTDKTRSMVLSVNDSRLLIIEGGGKGVSHARNMGIDALSGEYVMFVDADDELEADAVSRAVSLIEEYGYDIAIGGIRKVWPDGRRVDFAIDEDNPVGYCAESISAVQEATIGYSSVLDPRLNSCLLSGCWGRIIRCDTLKRCRFNESLPVGEDTAFNIEVLGGCESVVITPDIWYRYRQNSGSAVNSYRANAFAEGASLMEVLIAEVGSELQSAIERRSLYQLEGACRQRIALGCPEASFGLKARAIRNELEKGYWLKFLSISRHLSGIELKHKIFYFLAKRRMARTLCLLITLARR